jgi:hypothetical protein
MFAQWDEEWNTENEALLDTLSLNNCPPRLLWSQFGLTQAQVYTLSQYRTAMKYIVDPLELYGLEYWDSTTVVKILARLPINLHQNKPDKLQIDQKLRWQLGTRNSANHTLFFSDHQSQGALHQRYHFLAQGRVELLQSGFLSSTLGQAAKTTIVFGDLQLAAGQGLLWDKPTFSNPISEERFATGVFGKRSSATTNYIRGMGLHHIAGPWTLSTYADTGTSAGVQILYKTAQGSVGAVGNNSGAIALHAKVIKGPLRIFSEARKSRQLFGLNYFSGDVLAEYRVDLKQDLDGEIRHNFNLSWRDSRGNWNIRVLHGKLKVQWNDGAWRYNISEHRTADRQSFRHRIHYESPYHWTIDGHLHGKTKGIQFRYRPFYMQPNFVLQWTFVDYIDLPVWASTPYMPGSIPSLALNEDWAGVHLKFHKKNWYSTLAWNFAQNDIKKALNLSMSLNISIS